MEGRSHLNWSNGYQKHSFDTGTGNNKRLLNISDMAKSLTPMYWSALLSLHAFTGYDTTSAFKGCEKLRPLKILENDDEYKNIFSIIGDEWSLNQVVKYKMEAFTCAIYGKPCIKYVNMAHFQK